MDIHEPLPDPETLGLDDAKALRERLLTRVRPHILRRLTALGAIADPDMDAQIERIELELRLNEIDNHDWALDARITSEEPPPLAYLMPAELEELEVGTHKATTRATLFYSPEAKFNVHGPIMLLHAAALAEKLLAPGETLIRLDSASFSRMVISQLRLTVADSAEIPRSDIASASVSGSFATSTGRRLAFHGVQDHAHPVARRCWGNRAAIELLPPGFPFVRDGAAYIIRTPAAKLPALGVPAQLMTLLDVLVLMMLSQHLHPDETRLLVSIRDLPMSPAMLDTLAADTEIRFTPHVGKARRVGEAMLMMPVDIAFARSPDARTRVIVGESSEPYYRMPVG